jgi:hypothetical protein
MSPRFFSPPRVIDAKKVLEQFDINSQSSGVVICEDPPKPNIPSSIFDVNDQIIIKRVKSGAQQQNRSEKLSMVFSSGDFTHNVNQAMHP